jgi:integrase
MEDGSALRPEHLRKLWAGLCRKAGVPDLGLHAARHGQVRMLRQAGLPDYLIAARLGHLETVMRDVYGLPNDGEGARAADVMDRILGGV